MDGAVEIADRQQMGESSPSFFEFFAGGGMVRAGLGEGWRCLFANDIDRHKARAYAANWGDEVFHLGDVHALELSEMGGRPDLVWGSFPCQDLSLAGAGRGLRGERSGAFFGFWRAIESLIADGRGPALVAIENVCGTLTSNGGHDFAAVCRAFAENGFRFGALVIDAAMFLPQSRPRLFVIGLRSDLTPPSGLVVAQAPAHSGLRRAVQALPPELRAQHLWWSLPAPPPVRVRLADMIEVAPHDVAWRSVEQTQALLGLMSPAQLRKVSAAKAASKATGIAQVGCLFRRMRVEAGVRVQRAEVRFDGLAGCLRTSSGGSSRQILMLVEGEQVRTRLLSSRETARLMGLSETYSLPNSHAQACHLTGDGVVVDVVRWLARELFEPALQLGRVRRAA